MFPLPHPQPLENPPKLRSSFSWTCGEAAKGGRWGGKTKSNCASLGLWNVGPCPLFMIPAWHNRFLIGLKSTLKGWTCCLINMLISSQKFWPSGTFSADQKGENLLSREVSCLLYRTPLRYHVNGDNSFCTTEETINLAVLKKTRNWMELYHSDKQPDCCC